MQVKSEDTKKNMIAYFNRYMVGKMTAVHSYIPVHGRNNEEGRLNILHLRLETLIFGTSVEIL